MKYAISMYLAGFLVHASECDYNSYKELGLKCPFCDQAVYLRCGYTCKTPKGNDRKVEPFFSHYKAEQKSDYDCENRLSPRKRKETIDKIKNKARNQRLELYNDRLWEMFSYDRKVKNDYLKQFTKFLGTPSVDYITRKAHKCLSRKKKLVRIMVEDYVEMLASPRKIQQALLEAKESSTMFGATFQDYKPQIDYFRNRCNREVHKMICNEIIDFLSTKNGKYALRKIISCILIQALASDQKINAKFNFIDAKKPHPELKRRAKYIVAHYGSSNQILYGLIPTIISTHWIDVINVYLGIKL